MNSNPCPCCNLTVAECISGRSAAVDAILARAAAAWDVTVEDLRRKTRTGPAFEARILAMALLRSMDDPPSEKLVGALFGMDRGTVANAVQLVWKSPSVSRRLRVFNALLSD